VEIGRGDVEALVEEVEEVVGYDAFEKAVVEETHFDPETVELGAAEESLALGFESFVKVADEIDGADFVARNLFVFAMGGQEIERSGIAQAYRVKVAAEGFAVEKLDDDFFVGRGWRAGFQGRWTGL
jgi:signal recognition particle GTPase